MATKKKEVQLEKKCNILCQLCKTLFYDAKREQLSRTALMNFVFFSLAVTAVILGLIGFEIEEKILVFIGTLTGGGFLQYSYGKLINK